MSDQTEGWDDFLNEHPELAALEPQPFVPFVERARWAQRFCDS